MVNLLDRVSMGHASPLFDGAMLPWDSNLQGHKAPALTATLGEPLEAVAFKTERVFFGRLKLGHLRFSM